MVIIGNMQTNEGEKFMARKKEYHITETKTEVNQYGIEIHEYAIEEEPDFTLLIKKNSNHVEEHKKMIEEVLKVHPELRGTEKHMCTNEYIFSSALRHNPTNELLFDMGAWSPTLEEELALDIKDMPKMLKLLRKQIKEEHGIDV